MTDQTLPAPADLSGDYTLDPVHTRLGFSARHAMVTKVHGSFKDFEGHLHIDAADPKQSSARVVIQAKSIDTGSDDRDTHLRSNDFFSMDEYPTITFQSTGAERVDDDHFRVTGDLTIKDVTKPITIEFELTGVAQDPWGQQRIGFEGSTTVNRKDWGVNWNTALEAGGVLVSDKVKIELDLSAVKAS
jgi:polyisoprenoid-binding protein YceI